MERVVRLSSCPVLTVPPRDVEQREPGLRRVVFATDFSDFSDRAFPYAVSVAARYAAELIMVHVVKLHAFDPANPAWRVPEITLDHMKSIEDAAANELDGRGEKARALSVNVQIRTLRGFDPAAEIVNLAEEENTDLVVMATHGHTGLMHALLGSTAEQVVRLSTRPVLTVHPAKE